MFPRTRPDPLQRHTRTTLDTQPNLRILDVGFGWGRLLGGLLAFPGYITTHLEYVGCEPTSELLESSKAEMGNLQAQMLGGGRFEDIVGAVSFSTWEELLHLRRSYFDYVYLVNVLHHVSAVDIPELFTNIFKLVRDDGYLVIHDFFFGAPSPERWDVSKYCDDGVFYGPQHVSALFTMASSQTGVYRVMRRGGLLGHYDLFTFILQFANDLAKSGPTSDFSFTVDIPTALNVILQDLATVSAGGLDQCSRNHAARIACGHDALRKSTWRTRLAVPPADFAAEKWLLTMAPPRFPPQMS
ncbi:MAG: methyltransferase [Thermoanaerobaculia bacterium]